MIIYFIMSYLFNLNTLGFHSFWVSKCEPLVYAQCKQISRVKLWTCNPALWWLKVTDALGWFWQSSQVCAATKAKQSGSLCSVAPSQSATANWLLWEPRRTTHTHTVQTSTQKHTPTEDLPAICWGLAHTGAPLLLLSQLSAHEVFEVPAACCCVWSATLCRVIVFCKSAVYDSSPSKQPLLPLPQTPSLLLLSTWVLEGYTSQQELSITQMLHSTFHTASIVILLLIRFRSVINTL